MGYALPARRLKTCMGQAGLLLVDVAVVCLLLRAGKSLQLSQMAGFGVAVTLHWVSLGSASLQRSRAGLRWAIHVQMLGIAVSSLLLRSAVLALLVGRCEWQPQFAILLAAPTGLLALLGTNSLIVSGHDPAERWRNFVIALTIYSSALRLLYAGSVDLMPEETYYWSYSQHLDIGYLDHPPLVAWLVRMATAVLGQTEFAVRAGAIFCGALSSFFVYRLTRNVFGDTAALASLALTQALPFFFLAGLLMTPDSPLTASWAACLYFLERALVAGKAAAWWQAGVALGIGLISKYTILLLAFSALAYVLWDPRTRHWLRQYQPYVATLCALAIFAPVLLWNIEHHWISFAFQTSGRLAEKARFALPNLLGSVIVLLSPVGALALVFALIRSGEQRVRGYRLLALATLLPLAVFFLFSLRHQVKLDWTGAPLVAAVPLLSAAMVSSGPKLAGLRSWIRAAWSPTLASLLFIYAAGLCYLVLGWPGVGYGTHIEILPVGWRDLSRQVLTIAQDSQRESGDYPVIVGMDRYAIASEIAFQGTRLQQVTPLTSSAHLFQGVGLMYELWTPADSLAGKTLLLVGFDPRDLGGEFVEPRAASFGPIGIIALERDGRAIRNMYYRFAYDYRP